MEEGFLQFNMEMIRLEQLLRRTTCSSIDWLQINIIYLNEHVAVKGLPQDSRLEDSRYVHKSLQSTPNDLMKDFHLWPSHTGMRLQVLCRSIYLLQGHEG